MLERSLVRIFQPNGQAAGAGILVDDRHALTCAHVVASALELRKNPSNTFRCNAKGN